jgi:hypothetical protein
MILLENGIMSNFENQQIINHTQQQRNLYPMTQVVMVEHPLTKKELGSEQTTSLSTKIKFESKCIKAHHDPIY